MKLSEIRHCNTAINRTKESRIIRLLVEKENLFNRNPQYILDSGCGYGKDVEYLVQNGYVACGHDHPYNKFKSPTFHLIHNLPDFPEFDMIISTYVLNTIPTKEQKILYLQNLAANITDNGLLILSVRTKKEIEKLANIKKWKKFKDGYISSQTRKTFQMGFNLYELKYYLVDGGFIPTNDIGIQNSDYCIISARVDI